eukprot:TRINITY_DN49751_c0_g1_i1.p1 TRINITY_DN49751_c0_g1~~TRINITY_DN49751_c0_g1_i1.p1  ORF type:complete len:173 (+),score=20.93 TRINITY_DN49751_c0_g1_i1:170-688(+)
MCIRDRYFQIILSVNLKLNKFQQKEMSSYAASLFVPTKFILLMSQFLIVLVAYKARNENIFRGLADGLSADSSEYDKAEKNVLVSVALTITTLVIEFMMLFHGLTMFHDKLNAITCLTHALGVVLYASFIMKIWHYFILWYLWVFFSLLPFCLLYTSPSPRDRQKSRMPSSA